MRDEVEQAEERYLAELRERIAWQAEAAANKRAAEASAPERLAQHADPGREQRP